MARTRATAKPDAQQPGKPVKFTLTLPADLAKRFGVHAEMTGTSYSDLFAEMVQGHCRRFIVHDHGKDDGRGRGVVEAPGDAA